jgi:hypothetical protein
MSTHMVCKCGGAITTRYWSEAEVWMQLHGDCLLTFKPEWRGLTDEEIHNTGGYREDRELYWFARTIEAKLKEKNALPSAR